MLAFSERGIWDAMLPVLTAGRRAAMGKDPEPDFAVVDSQSVRSALPQSEKGADGNKKTKGIKRTILVDDQGYPLGVVTSKANVHDSVAAMPLLRDAKSACGSLSLVKADMGYGGTLHKWGAGAGLTVECVKSNFGTPDFKPIDGRWVVERTFS